MTVPVHILSGFLGAGKTTTLLHFLRELSGTEQVAVVVNDFGEANIDSTVLGEESVVVDEITGACICCTAPAGFVTAMGSLVEQRPDRIFVEPTGLAHPADLVDMLRRAPYADRIDVRPVIVLLDPGLGIDRVSLAREQLECADILVGNKTDLATPEQMAAFRSLAAGLWPKPVVFEVSHGQLPVSVLSLEADHDHHHHHHHDHDHDHDHDHNHDHASRHTAKSWVWPGETVFSRERLGDVIAGLVVDPGSRVVRLKGLFRTEQGTFLVEIASGRVHERESAHRRDSRLDVICEGAVPAIDDVLDGAVLTEVERSVDATRIDVVMGNRRTRIDHAALAALPNGVDDVSVLLPKRRGAAARVASLFGRLGIEKGEVVVVASDGFASPAVPVEALREGLLLHSLDGAPLPVGKGGPFRLLIPGDAGPAGPCSNVKGVVQLVVRFPAP